MDSKNNNNKKVNESQDLRLSYFAMKFTAKKRSKIFS